MNETQLKNLLNDLLKHPENEVVEFKEAKNTFSTTKTGEYFSALSNEANLRNKEYAWLIFGISDKERTIVGSRFLAAENEINNLKNRVSEFTVDRHTFFDIHIILFPEGRVVMCQIPSAPKGLPISYRGHYYGRAGDSLVPLSLQKIEQIRREAIHDDWSAEIIGSATIDDLDADALKKAREEYREKHPKQAEMMDQWSDATFLNKAKLTTRGKITRATLLLLGREESAYLLNPAVVQISWILKDANNRELDYEHFSMPLILASEKVMSKIRNLSYRYMPENTLFPIEIPQYDNYVIREALHNCIAHQDYRLQSRIVVVEFSDHVIFDNAGKFLPESVETVIEEDAPQKFYRNRFLCEAMVNLNMIDTIGSGIKKMFCVQRNRFFPLPDYDLKKSNTVKVKIFGRVLDKNYTQLLMDKADLDLRTVILLDKLQKGRKLSSEEAGFLKTKKLIEGRKPNYYVTASLAGLSGDKAKYIKSKGLKDLHYKELIIKYLEQFGSATRQEIDELLLDSLPQIMTDEQKKKKYRICLQHYPNTRE